MKKTLDFQAPPTCWGNDNFEICLHAAAMFLDGRMTDGVTKCGKNIDDKCAHCGFGLMFNTIFGWPYYRRAYGNPPDNTRLYNEMFDKMGNKAKFMFGYAGYEYRRCNDAEQFKNEIITSINAGKPVLAEITDEAYERSRTEFQLIIGYDGDELITPQYRIGKPSDGMGFPYGKLTYKDIHGLIIIGDKVTPQFTYTDIVKRNRAMVQANLDEKVWDKYLEEIERVFINQDGNGEERNVVFNEVCEAAKRHMSSWDFGESHKRGYFEITNKEIFDKIWQNNCEGMDMGHFVTHCHEHMNVKKSDCHYIYFGKMLVLIIERYRELDKELLDLLNQFINN